MIDVLVVDDTQASAECIVHVLGNTPGIRVVGTVNSGEEALSCVRLRRPDVIVMDMNLPGIDGLETTRRIMSSDPVPIVLCTASTHASDVHTAMRAMEAGALAVVKKPGALSDPGARAEAEAIASTVKLMSEVKLVRRWARVAAVPASLAEPGNPGDGRDPVLVAIGASTGGPPAILEVLSGLSRSFPVPILVVQHIATGFTAGFADWLARASGLEVSIATAGTTPRPGHVYVAPDDRHLRIGLRGEMQTTREEPWNGLRPSIGVLFRSLAERYGRRAIGVLLTGMGRDGADELKLMADSGALTVAQDEETSAVFGMPGEAVKLGAARFVLPPHRIAGILLAAVGRSARAEARS